MTGAELADRTDRRLSWAMVTANVAGALIVFVFVYFLLPLGGQDEARQRLVNLAVFGGYLGASAVAGSFWGRRSAAPLRSWLTSDRPADAVDRAIVMREPLRQTRVNAAMWGAAAVLFGGLNVYYDPRTAIDITITIVLGGFATCGIAYLLCERTLRPVVTRAMSGALEPPPVLLGVAPRLLLGWALGSGIPLIGILLGVTAATGAHPPLGRPAITFLAVVGLVVGLLAIGAAAGAVSDPVRSVATALRQVGEGQLDVTVPVYDASEVGRLQSGFNAMVQGLRERDQLRDLFGRQVGDDVARLAFEHGVELGGEVREVAVLFVDVVGSTGLALAGDPPEVVRRLNAFFSVVVQVVTAHGGWVNKFEGDATLCVFGAPMELPDAPDRALAAARELAQRLVPLPLEAAIGVAAGPVVAGHVGAESRFEYTVIGDPVNVAARLTELAKTFAGRVLADAEAVGRAGPAEQQCWQAVDPVVLRGRDRPTRLARPRAGR